MKGTLTRSQKSTLPCIEQFDLIATIHFHSPLWPRPCWQYLSCNVVTQTHKSAKIHLPQRWPGFAQCEARMQLNPWLWDNARNGMILSPCQSPDPAPPVHCHPCPQISVFSSEQWNDLHDKSPRRDPLLPWMMHYAIIARWRSVYFAVNV